MGKLLTEIENQMTLTGFEQDARGVRRIYDYFMRTDGHVWRSRWDVLVNTLYKKIDGGYKMVYKPSTIGEIFLKGLDSERE